MSYPVVDYPWLWQWWDAIRASRNAAPPACNICSATGTLVLIDLGTATSEGIAFDDLTTMCPRCTDRAEQVVADRCADGQRWEMMPRMLAIRAVMAELTDGRLAIAGDERGEPVW